MRQNPDSKTNELAFRQEVGREIARHKALTEECSKIFQALSKMHSDKTLKTLCSISDGLGKSSGGLLEALNKWSRCLIENTVPDSGEQTGPAKSSMTRREEIVGLKSKLAESRKRLSEREEQIEGLLNEGLRLALKKEELEKQLLIPDHTCLHPAFDTRAVMAASTPNHPGRVQLADFMEQVLAGSGDRASWFPLIVTHYRDKAMEVARREFVRLVSFEADGEISKLTAAERNHLQSLALGLR